MTPEQIIAGEISGAPFPSKRSQSKAQSAIAALTAAGYEIRKVDPGIEWQPIETVPLFRLILVYGIWEGEINGKDRVPDRHLVSTENGKYFPIHGSEAYAAWVNNPTHWAPIPEPPTGTERAEKVENGSDES